MLLLLPRFFLPLCLLLCVTECISAQDSKPAWEMCSPETKASFRAISAIDAQVCWVGGSQGNIWRTEDGGKTWIDCAIPGVDSLDFRDIQGFSAQKAIAMSAGPGRSSRLYSTEDGGKNWQLRYENKVPQGFFNGFAFWNEQEGILAGDPIEGVLFIMLTKDGGQSWRKVKPTQIPALAKGEYGFSASGTHLFAGEGGRAWVVTGGSKARVFYSIDGGENWAVSPSPMQQGQASEGIFSIAFSGPKYGLAVGGDYAEKNQEGSQLILTKNGGKTWRKAPQDQIGFHSAIAFAGKKTILCVGQSQEHISYDRGKSWEKISQTGFHTLSISPDQEWAWAAGAKGKVARMSLSTK